MNIKLLHALVDKAAELEEKWKENNDSSYDEYLRREWKIKQELIDILIERDYGMQLEKVLH
jgi:hypothetical protein